ncbi:MAG TPA: DUF402 domain-containing protein [Candidatus Saccharimonadales bacterium]|nr:DUF402 domain-containing protein [Candidatus Saccharimonadales bacterium]
MSKNGTVIERKTRLDGSSVEFACVGLAVEPGRSAVLGYTVDRDWTVAGGVITVPKGAVTVGHFWADRPYNVYHWLVEGWTLAYYVNVSAPPRITVESVDWLDLAVDILVRPDASFLVLDEDEVPTDLDPVHRRTIARALEAVVTSPRGFVLQIEAASRPHLPAWTG